MIRSILVAGKKCVRLSLLLAGVLGWVLAAGLANAQDAPPPATLPSALAAPISQPPAPSPIVDPNVQPASCASCGMAGPGGSGGLAGCMHGGCGLAGGSCYPGRTCNLGCFANSDSCLGRLFGCLCEEICCPDPCYEPAWIPAANAALFQDGPRPVTQTRIRWDAGMHYNFPDTNEFFWAQMTKKGPAGISPAVNYNAASLYQEVAAKGASLFVEIPYLTVDPISGNPSAANIGDMNVGTKTVFLDRDLILITGQFRTYIPTGNFNAGTGTGHVSLEPSILAALKLTNTTYLQTQLSDWLPLGASPGFSGAVFHYHVSLNQNLCHVGDCFNMVGTIEFNGYSFHSQYTEPTGVIGNLGGSNYCNAGPGVRFQFCNRCDLGFGMAFGFGNDHGPNQLYRTELRIRY